MLCAGVCGVVVGRWVLAVEKSEFGVCGVVGGMMVIELLAYTVRSVRGRIAAGEVGWIPAGRESMWLEK